MRELGGQIGRLIDAQLAHGADAVGVVDERRAVFDHRVHDRPPAHAQLGGYHRYCPGFLAHLPARFGAGPAGENHLGVDVGRAFGPALGVAVRVHTAPPALDPPQPGGATEAGKVADVDGHAVLGLGPRPAASAADDIEAGLDREDELVGRLVHLEDPEPVQSQKCLRQPDTVGHRRDLPSSQPSTATTIAGSLPALVDPRLPHAPHSNA
jgi:hypothetical protein